VIPGAVKTGLKLYALGGVVVGAGAVLVSLPSILQSGSSMAGAIAGTFLGASIVWPYKLYTMLKPSDSSSASGSDATP